MKKLFLGVAVVFAALIGAILIVPSFIDWNDYKPEIAAQAKKATGRALTIEGDIRIAILPTPALVAHKVRFANVKGATDADMARFESVEVRMAVKPLLMGKVQFETIKLIEPVISLEVLPDGSKNWDIQLQENAQQSQAKAQAQSQPSSTSKNGTAGQQKGSPGIALSLDNFVISNGTVIFRDHQKKQTERIEQINARIAMGSLSGPFEASGTLRAKGLPFELDATLGKIIEGRTASLSVNLAVAGRAAKIQATGAIVNLAESPTVKAKLIGEGKSLAEIIHVTTKTGTLPGVMGQPFRIEGEVIASAAASSISGLVVRLGDIQAKGTISLTTDQKSKLPNIITKLAINRVDLDKLLALPDVSPAKKFKNNKQSWFAVGRAFAADGATAKAQKASENKPTPGNFIIPADVLASLNMTLDTLNYRGGVIRQVKANIELANGEVTISQVSAQLPGTTDIALFGFLTAKGGTPRFDGEVEVVASNIRGVARWLGTALPELPSGRMRRVTIASKFSATPQQINVAGLDLQFDSSRLTGAATVALRQPIAFGANLVLDRLNLDAYLSQNASGQSGKGKKTTVNAGKNKNQIMNQQASSPSTSPLAALGFLKSFDANLKAHVRTLVYRGTQIKNIVVDGTLFNNTLDIRRASIAKFAGASVNLSGKIEKLVGLPILKNVHWEFNAPNINRFIRAAGLDAPSALQKLGKVTVMTYASGSIFKPKLNARIQAAGADVTLAGTVSALPVIGGINLSLAAKHGNLPQLLRALKVNYRPSGRIGGFDITANIKGDAKKIDLNDLKGTIGKVTLNGSAGVDLKGARPKLHANLTTGHLIVDPFLPAKRKASNDFFQFAGLQKGDEKQPRQNLTILSAWRAPAIMGQGRSILHQAARRSSRRSESRWPMDTIDLSGLRAFDATVNLNAPSVTYNQYRLDNADIGIVLASGVLKTSRLTGGLFGGTLQGAVTVNAAKALQADANLIIKNVNARKLDKTLSRGLASVDVTVNTNGNNVAQMISRLNGKGSFVLEGLDVRSKGKGSSLAGILNLVVGLNKLGGQLGGSRKGKGLADVTGSFTIDKGIARTQDIKLLSSVGNGEATGVVDLPSWYIDVNGQVVLSQNVLTKFLTKNNKTKTTLPFRVYGKLDAPNVKLDTSKIKGGIPIPGLGNLIKKKPGVGKILDQFLPGLGGSSQQQPQTQQPQTQQPAPAPKKKIRPEDILKDLFGIR